MRDRIIAFFERDLTLKTKQFITFVSVDCSRTRVITRMNLILHFERA